MPKIISSSALRNGYNEVSDWCREHQEPVFVTKNGAGDLAVMDIRTYEQLVARLDLLKELAEGHRDVLEGRTHDAREGVGLLREEFGL
ncbi:type II toxin-antitoxin system Phd/YefM family antitoxin [Collinsella tanakaei]|uniref:type II toxin-antitoxin system prevent-host-death family antitoxin n=1 Tax=Collinsella tanakaei TaxID=626935 RepID=UPI00195A50FF|nr:type II toxin-antitoxin system prevent-host-death family antitoxin [Collinsella tanakaei]MBM6778627.1 type II toxin-antitoxin system Phd/YefM family antitoxin [Collinsella tanakaei]